MTVGARPGLFGRLRELSTRRRAALGALLALGVSALVLLALGHRTDLGPDAALRHALLLGGLLVLTGLVFAVGLRGHEAPPARGRLLAVVGLALLVPVALSLLPDLWSDPEMPAEVPVFLCALPGMLTGVAVGALVWGLQRGAGLRAGRVVAVLAGGGVAGFGMLQLHCPARDAQHMLVGHASVGFGLLILAAVAFGVTRLLRR